MPANSQPLANGVIDGWQTILIPELSLMCGMSKTTVSIAELTVLGNMQMNGTLNPTIQIWRQSNKDKNRYSLRGDDLRLYSNECKLIQARNEAQLPEADIESVSSADANGNSAAKFRCKLNFTKDLRVQSKYILGIELPPKQTTMFEILFKDSTWRNYYITILPGRYSSQHTVNLTNFTDIFQQPQINLKFKNPGK